MQEKRSKNKIKKSIISKNASDTELFAKSISKRIHCGDIICLEGDLGVGKTVFAKAIGSFFNISETITSPTFTILKTYNVKNSYISRIHHFDLYRIKNEDELLNLCFEEYIYDDNAISIIEWPEVAHNLIASPYKKITISKLENDENKRKIVYEEF